MDEGDELVERTRFTSTPGAEQLRGASRLILHRRSEFSLNDMPCFGVPLRLFWRGAGDVTKSRWIGGGGHRCVCLPPPLTHPPPPPLPHPPPPAPPPPTA